MRLTVISSGSAGNCYVLQGSGSALVLECGAKPETALLFITKQQISYVNM